MPFFNCEVLFSVLDGLAIEVAYYPINSQLEPIFEYDTMEADSGFLYTNYFGLKDAFVQELSGKIEHLIVDNCQAFFSHPIEGIDTFYSPRKFFGVPDGAYLSTNKRLAGTLEIDRSEHRLKHLVGRKEHGPQLAYSDFKQHELSLNTEPLKEMSKFTDGMLSSIAYEKAKEKRNENYQYLHEALGSQNSIAINFDTTLSPLAYPFISNKVGLRERLILEQIFVPTYWPAILQIRSEDTLEYYFAKNVLPLPIDHRYDLEDMKRIVKSINSYANV